MILIRAETEKTHREFSVPITDGIAPIYGGYSRKPSR